MMVMMMMVIMGDDCDNDGGDGGGEPDCNDGDDHGKDVGDDFGHVVECCVMLVERSGMLLE